MLVWMRMRLRAVLMKMRIARVRFVIVVRVLCLNRRSVGCKDIHLGCGQTAAAHLVHLQPRAYIQRGRCRFKAGEGEARIHHGPQQHIAAYAGKALQITYTHSNAILNCLLCTAPGQHFDGQNGIHRTGAKSLTIERDVLEASQF